MYAEINDDGVLILTPQGSTENFALTAWKEMGAKIGIAGMPPLKLSEPVNEGPAVTIPTPEKPKEEVNAEDPFAERNRVKAELTALGIPFNNKARTDVLAKLLEEQKAVSVKQAPAVPSAVDASALPTQPETPSFEAPAVTSVEVVREAIKKYAAIKGAPKAMELLGKYNSNNVSGLPAEKYSEIVEFVNQETK